MKGGRVVRARLDGKDEPSGAEAVYQMLEWLDGRFEFSVLDVDMEDEVKVGTQHLLLEGARRQDERQASSSSGASS
jgi:hypothetical protein